MSADVQSGLEALATGLGLSEGAVEALAGRASLLSLPQDRVLELDGSEPAYLVVLRGQVAAGTFAEGKVPPAPKNPKKRVPPVMREAERIVALFEEGDVFANDFPTRVRGADGVRRELALFSCLGIDVLRLPVAAFEAAADPEARTELRRRLELGKARRAELSEPDRAELLDFYVKQGLEYAHEIKVIQTERCIDCDECVRACSERHGFARIERFGPRVGLVQLTDNCRSCQEPRCVAACNSDAIGFDPAADDTEVIVYANCIGCQLCAKACPHEAIEMVGVPEPEPEIDLVKLASERPVTRIAKGEERPKKKKIPLLANKCDHCFGFSDMACISACPTGAIIQISPRELFRRDEGKAEAVDRYFDEATFALGFSQVGARYKPRGMHLWLAICALFVAAAFWEYLARRLAPEQALSTVVGPLLAIPTELSLTPVSGFLRWLGYLGAAMMVISALYTVRLHLPVVRRAGKARAWFDLHIAFGLAGPALSLLHTNFSIVDFASRPLVVSLWWAVFLVVLSGLFGRYLYTAIPRLEVAARQRAEQLDRSIAQLARTSAERGVERSVPAQFRTAMEKAEAAPPASSLFAELRAWLRAEWRRWSSRRSLLEQIRAMPVLAEEAGRLLPARAALHRRVQRYGVIQRLLGHWRTTHIAITLLMFVMLAAHVAISVYATGWGF